MSESFISYDMELLFEASQSLWRETNFDRLIKRFVGLLGEKFHLTQYRLVKLIAEKDKLKTEKASIKGSASKLIPALEFLKVETALLKLDLKHAEFRQGFNNLRVEDQEYFFLAIGDPEIVCYLLVWQASRGSEKSDFKMMANCLDFISRQLQNAFSWFQKLDKTQALLYQDDLTGLFNVRYLDVALDSEIRRVQRFRTCFSLLFIDLDNFKEINDTYGHLAGSALLKQTAEVLRSAAREVDILTRYGGDEFIVLLIGANADTAILAGERIRRKIEATAFAVDGSPSVSVTASIGVATCPDHALNKTSLLSLADGVMYESKRRGKNRVSLAQAGVVTIDEKSLPLT